MITMDPVGAGASVSSSAQVSLSKKAGDQQEQVVGKLLESVEQTPKPEPRANHSTGKSVNVEA